jgi:hypothetical protein
MPSTLKEEAKHPSTSILRGDIHGHKVPYKYTRNFFVIALGMVIANNN